MPLFDSLSASASQSHRLSKMGSIPTTEDLKYALEEATKRRKPVELPFKHPHNHQSFVVRVQLGQGTAPPTWTFLRGDGANAKVLWSRPTVEVLMIQNKIKTESAQTDATPAPVPYWAEQPEETQPPEEELPLGSSGAHQAIPESTYPPLSQADSQPMYPPPAGATPAPSQFGDLIQPPSPFGSSRQPPTPFGAPTQPPSQFTSGQHQPPQQSATPPSQFTSGQHQPPQQSATPPSQFTSGQHQPPQQFASPPPSQFGQHAPPGGSVSQTPSAVPGSGPTTNAPIQQSVQPQSAQVQTQKSYPPPQTPLPPGLPLDRRYVDEVQALLSDLDTGFSTLEAAVFLLLRAWERHQKDGSPAGVVVYDVAIQYSPEQIVPLPEEALRPLSGRLQSACSSLDTMAHLGAGEFLVVLENSNAGDVKLFCERLYAALTEAPLLPDANTNKDLALISIGAASMPEICTDPEVLVAAARQAKEMAKQAHIPLLFFP